MKDKQLGIKIEDGVIKIEIGVGLAMYNIQNDFNESFHFDGCKITDESKFAEDVCLQLLEEDHDGTTMVHELLFKAGKEAIEQGSEWVKARAK